MAVSPKSPFNIHHLTREGIVINSTVSAPKNKSKTILKKSAREFINPSDQIHFFDTLKKVVTKKVYDFVSYSVAPAISFISIMIPVEEGVLMLELASGSADCLESQKQQILEGARKVMGLDLDPPEFVTV